MANKAISFLRGNVQVCIESGWPERIFNVCSARGIALHSVVWKSATDVVVSVSRRDFPALRSAVKSIGAELHLQRKSGVPFLLLRLRRRYALLSGLALLVLLLAVNSLFIWDFSVTGNEIVSSVEILHVLSDCGVHRGTFVYSFRSQDICNRALLELPELSWLTVNVRGCRAHVQVSERVQVPDIAQEGASNVISRRDALITKVLPLGGEAKVLPGNIVARGQLLISGVVETQGVDAPSVDTRILAGHGEVWGKTWYELCIAVPLSYEYKQYTGEEKHSYSLLWGEKRLKFTKDSSILHVSCDKIITQKPWTLLSVCVLPITGEKETLRAYNLISVTRTRGEAEAIGKQALKSYLASILGAGDSIASTRYASAEQSGQIIITLSAECLEQIGQTIPITINDTIGGK